MGNAEYMGNIARGLDRIAGTDIIDSPTQNEVLLVNKCFKNFENSIKTEFTAFNQKNNESFGASIRKISELTHTYVIKETIKQQFGEEAISIIKYLNANGQLKEKQIAEICTTHPNLNPSIMFKMMERRFLRIFNK